MFKYFIINSTIYNVNVDELRVYLRQNSVKSCMLAMHRTNGNGKRTDIKYFVLVSCFIDWNVVAIFYSENSNLDFDINVPYLHFLPHKDRLISSSKSSLI